MTARAFLFLFALALISVPGSASGSPSVEGSEAQPEFTDASGNIQYGPTYTGPRNQDFLDLVAGWWDYNATTNLVTFHFKSLDNTRLRDHRETQVNCGVRARASAGGQTEGNLTFSWGKQDDSVAVNGSMSFDRYRNQPVDENKAIRIRSAFSITFGAPGYANLSVELSRLKQFAEQIDHVYWGCRQTGWSYAGAKVQQFENQNSGEANVLFRFEELKPSPIPATEFDPIETLDPIYITYHSAPPTGQPTPGVSAAWAAVVAAGAAVSLGRRR